MINWSLLLLFTSLLTIPAWSSTVTVDYSLSSLLNAAHLPSPHPDLRMVLSRQLVGAGFHRTLLTHVEQVTSHQSGHIPDPSKLYVAIVENITRDVYVDVDQVRKVCFCGCP